MTLDFLFLAEAAGLIRHLLTVNPAKRATMSDILSHWWVNLGHKTMPDAQPYVCPMVLQPVPACPNERLSSDSDGEPELSARPKTQRPLKGILKKPKMTDSRVESSNSTGTRNENSNPVTSQTVSQTIHNSAKHDQNGYEKIPESKKQTEESFDSKDSDVFSANTELSGKKVFDAQRMPARSILKRKGKFSAGDSGCELNDSKSKSSSISSNVMDLSEVDSAIDSPDYSSAINSKDTKNSNNSLSSGAFNFPVEQGQSEKNSSNGPVGDIMNMVVRRRKGILKNSSRSKEDADKRLSACSIGSNSSADMLDFSYDSCEDLLSPHYYRQRSPRSSSEYEQDVDFVLEKSELSNDVITFEEARDVYAKALEICKNL